VPSAQALMAGWREALRGKAQSGAVPPGPPRLLTCRLREITTSLRMPISLFALRGDRVARFFLSRDSHEDYCSIHFGRTSGARSTVPDSCAACAATQPAADGSSAAARRASNLPPQVRNAIPETSSSLLTSQALKNAINAAGAGLAVGVPPGAVGTMLKSTPIVAAGMGIGFLTAMHSLSRVNDARQARASAELKSLFPNASSECLNAHRDVLQVLTSDCDSLANTLLDLVKTSSLAKDLKFSPDVRTALRQGGVTPGQITTAENLIKDKVRAAGALKYFPELAVQLPPESAEEHNPTILLARLNAQQVTTAGKFTVQGVTHLATLGCSKEDIDKLEVSNLKLASQMTDYFPMAVPEQRKLVVEPGHVLPPGPSGRQLEQAQHNLRFGVTKSSKQALEVSVQAYSAGMALTRSELSRIIGKGVEETRRLIDDLQKHRLIDAQLRPAHDQVAAMAGAQELSKLLDRKQADRLTGLLQAQMSA
jgi:hypothetical protein